METLKKQPTIVEAERIKRKVTKEFDDMESHHMPVPKVMMNFYQGDTDFVIKQL